jgi:pilus assembly protein FimV
MLKRNLCQLLVLALLSPAASYALGLGDIHLKSALNAPLDAEIDVVGANPEDLAGLRAQLAPREAFTKAGVDYPAYLSTLKVTSEKTADGRNILHVRSSDAVSEPFATLLVEADWPRGHVVREYTVLIDPPVFSNTQNPASAAVAAPTTGNSARSGSVDRQAAASSTTGATAPAARASSSAGSSAATAASSGASRTSSGSTGYGGGSYTVRNGDTLSSVAAQNYPGSDRSARHRQLVGIYRANPSAFEGNMNLLRAGSKLQLPGDAELQAISPGEASSEVRQQYQAWSGHAAAASGSGQLHLVPPQESGATPSNAPANPAAAPAPSGTPSAGASTAANQVLQSRVQQLESQLTESQRALQARNDELAQLQAQVKAAQANKNVAPAPTPPTPTPVPVPAPTQNAAPPPVVAPTPPASQTPAATPPPAAEAPTPAPAAAKPKPTAAPTPAGTSFLDLIEEYWYVPVALILIVIALLIMRFVRARQEDEFDRSVGRLHPAFEGTTTSSALRAVDTMPVRTLPAGAGEQSYRVEESGSHEQPTAVLHDRTTEGPAVTTGEHVVIDDTVTGEHPVALDQGDPLAEADFHMAYGLYDQAADLVQIAITREPNRRDLKLKLLEVFFVWGNKERFLQTARELANTRDQALPGEWEKVVIMGRQIAPEDSLFASTGALSGAASGGVDLNLEGGQNRVDFDLLGEPTASHEAIGGGVGLDLDLGAALGDAPAAAEADKLGDSGVDFVLDDPERGNDATGSTREMPEAPPRTGSGGTATMQVINTGHAPSDAPTVEQPQLHGGENATIREKIDAASRGSVSPDQTAELALDDLGLDLGALEGAGDETILQSGPDAPTMLAGMDDETRRLMSSVERDEDRTLITPPSAHNTSESGTWLFTDADLTDLVPEEERRRVEGDESSQQPTQVVTQITQPPPNVDAAATNRLQALDKDTAATGRMQALDVDANDLDLDLGQLDDEKPSDGIDLDVGSPSVGEGTFVQTQKIAQSDIPLPELEPATMSEVGTKLDLARAYMDMGDPEGARSILAEVLTEGSVSQKQEARRLMDTLPG